MSTTLRTSKGKQITLGKRLGEGGEGYVHAIEEDDALVAKLYHLNHMPDESKQNKLRLMVKLAQGDLAQHQDNTDTYKSLLMHVAWPQDTLHNRKNGRVIGFLMARIDNAKPIHTLYNPSLRQQIHPNATWEYLLYSARNIAVAMDSLHTCGHVIGDVNQANVLCHADSQIALIDADSFQIKSADTIYLCHVGVGHFTPPELQADSQFDSVPRTPNHDNFGLAILIFHLLLGGRHPYSGVPLIDEAGRVLEDDIKAYRYAYAPDSFYTKINNGNNTEREIKPPPSAIPIDILPNYLQQLFISAFTKRGGNHRPSAKVWFKALDRLLVNIETCDKNTSHTYSNHLLICPWCALEQKGLIYFGNPSTQKLISSPSAFRHTDLQTKLKDYYKKISYLPTYSVEPFEHTPFMITVKGEPLAENTYFKRTLVNKTTPKIVRQLFVQTYQYTTDFIEGMIQYLQSATSNRILSNIFFNSLYVCFKLMLLALFMGYVLFITGVILSALIYIPLCSILLFIKWLELPIYFNHPIDILTKLIGIIICFSPIIYVIHIYIGTRTRRKIALTNRLKITMNTEKEYIALQPKIFDLKEVITNYEAIKHRLEADYQDLKQVHNKINTRKITERQLKVLIEDFNRISQRLEDTFNQAVSYQGKIDEVYLSLKDQYNEAINAYAQARADLRTARRKRL